jgi:hypothetical protein
MIKALLAVAAVGLLSIGVYLSHGVRSSSAAAPEAAVPPPPPPPRALLHSSVPALETPTAGASNELPPENKLDPRINQDPRINRERITGELRASGRGGDSARIAEATALLQQVRTDAERDGDVHFSVADCYRAGCIVEARFKDGDTFFRRAHALGQATKDRWSGGLFLSGPEASADGSVSASLVLFTE